MAVNTWHLVKTYIAMQKVIHLILQQHCTLPHRADLHNMFFPSSLAASFWYFELVSTFTSSKLPSTLISQELDPHLF